MDRTSDGRSQCSRVAVATCRRLADALIARSHLAAYQHGPASLTRAPSSAPKGAFIANFEVRDELGAAFAAVVDGELVVDLWGGWIDDKHERAWAGDTLQLIFSGTKGLVATAVMVLLDRGLLRLDDRVVRYWPEFAPGGKGEITAGQAVSHQAGLLAIDVPLTPEDLLDDVAMAARVARQPPLWPAGEHISYHALTYGWIAGELIRRITGVSVGEFFASEIAGALQLEAWIGLPAALEERVSTISVNQSHRRRDA